MNHLNKCRSCRPYREMKKPDALHKIKNVFIKIQNTNTLDVKIIPQSGLLFVFG